MFDVIRIPAFKDNYIWLLRKEASAVVVDPGDACPVLDVLEQEGLSLSSILITHHHNDHQGGIADLLAHCPAEVFGPSTESITGLTRPLRGGETIRLGAIDAEFRVIAVPGHTRGHLGYYGSGCLFCGDTLFTGGCGRLFEGTPAQMLDSLDRLAVLPGDTRVCCTHEYTLANLRFAMAVEPDNAELAAYQAHCQQLRAQGQPTLPSSIFQETRINPFLRTRQASVLAAVHRFDASTHDETTVFAALRQWKNQFK